LEYEENESADDRKDFMAEAREKFLYAVEYERDNRDMALEDIKFGLLGEQWDAKDVEERKRSGRPTLTINKFPAHIRQVVNDARQNKPAIRVRPVDDNADVETAEIINGLIRNIEVSSNADIAYDTAITQAVSGGFPGYIRINVDFATDDTFDKDIKIDRVYNQFSVYGDYDATSADGSDWNKCWVIDRITNFEERFPGHDMVDFEVEEASDYDWINDDGVWIAEYWKREEVPKTICLLSDGDVVDEDVYEENIDLYESLGIQKVDSRVTKSHKVTQYIISGKEVLETNEWAGRYIPIVPCYGEEVVIENRRIFKSLIRDSKDPQKMLNFWRSTSTEVVSLQSKAPYLVEEGSLIDDQKWATANVKNYPYLTYKKGAQPPQRQPFAGVPAGALQEAMNSSDDIKATMGMFGASIGEQDNAISGKAIMARQRESDTGTFHFIDNLSRSIRHVGKIIVDLIPHVYQPGRIIRILGEDLKESDNARVGQPGQQPQQQEPGMDMTNVYDLTTGKYDVVVESGPSFGTRRQESAQQMIEFCRVNPAAASLISDLIAKNLDWQGAEEISERFKAMLPPQVTGENPQIQALQQQLQQMQEQAQQAMGQLQNEIQQIKQDKTIDMRKVDIDAYKAESDRIKVMQTGISPEQLQPLIMQTIMQVLNSPDVLPGQEQQPQQPEMQPQGVIQ